MMNTNAEPFFKNQYDQNNLAYHNWDHITLMLNLGNIFDVLKTRPNLYYAILAHDVVYQVEARDNETKSVEFFRSWAQESGFDGDVEKISQMIEATAHHLRDNSNLDEETQMLLDLDLASLAGNFALMNANTKLLAKEWLTVHNDLTGFYKSMQFFFESVLNKPKIFYQFDRFEESARYNCQKTLYMLKSDDVSVRSALGF
jgi:predicted metal-dependent HD superfamily phosphohydrolase